jgi:hypothetical protein
VSTSHSGAAHIAFERIKTLGPCDICSFVAQSHTPCIAVYASQPLSPATTQHSLPSGRYSLLGPDLHRLDRTSLRLAHLFDHLVGGHLQRQRHGKTERFRALEIDDEFEFGWLQHR